MKLTSETVEKVNSHALNEYPYECCGIISVIDEKQAVHLCENIQNRLHKEDPIRFQRDARTAYMIERSEFDRIISEIRNSGGEVIAFYHSHPEHEAYFSEEDVAAQTVFGEPEFPEALQVVISVMDRKINRIKCYKWSPEGQTFTEPEECC